MMTKSTGRRPVVTAAGKSVLATVFPSLALHIQDTGARWGAELARDERRMLLGSPAEPLVRWAMDHVEDPDEARSLLAKACGMLWSRADRKLSRSATRPQVYYDGWRQSVRVIDCKGSCGGCGRYTYSARDGENDPRGALGDWAWDGLVADEYGYEGPDVALCAICANTEHSYSYVLDSAKRKRWTPKADEVAS